MKKTNSHPDQARRPPLQERAAWRLAPLAAAVSSAVITFGLHLPATAADEPARSPIATEESKGDVKVTQAQFAEFDHRMLMGGAAASLEMAQFSGGQRLAPGQYRADVQLNTTWLGRFDLRVAAPQPGAAPVPCMSRELLQQLNVADAHFSAAALALLGRAPGAAPPSCLALEQAVPDATAVFDSGELKLLLSVPQAFFQQQARGSISPESWNEGVNAARLLYQINHYSSSTSSGSTSSDYIGLDAGANLAGWQFRHNGAYTSGSGTPAAYQSLNSNVQRNLPALKSTLTLGDGYTSGRLFDSFAVRGAILSSDERMLPESLRGFAPVIRGRAISNARVEVRQNKQLLYETSVAPGPFEITDLYPTGFGGDLIVTVFEADGTRREQVVPFAAGPSLLREGGLNHSLVLGQHRQSGGGVQVAQGELRYGLSNMLTLGGGLQAATGYASGMVGASLNTQWGAWSLDLATSYTTLPGFGQEKGNSVRGAWSKVLGESGTNLSFAAYRFSTEHFYGLNEAVSAYATQQGNGGAGRSLSRERSRAIINVLQSLGAWGNVYAQGSHSTYWALSGANTSFQLGYSRSIGPAQLSLNASRESFGNGLISTNAYTLAFSMPLGRVGESPASLNASLSSRGDGGTAQTVSYAAAMGQTNHAGYSLSATRQPAGQVAFASGFLRTSVARFSVSAGAGSGVKQYGASMSGALVIHPGGITLVPDLGDTIGVVQIDAADEGVRLHDPAASPPDSRGYTVLPYLLPYHRNEVMLNLDGATLDLQMTTTQESVVPTAGAVVMLSFKRDPGRTVVIATRRSDGRPLPFGANVQDEQGNTVGAVGQGSRLSVHLRQGVGQLSVSWGSEAEQRCTIQYSLPQRVRGKGLVELDLPCGPSSTIPSTPRPRPPVPAERAAQAEPAVIPGGVKVSMRDAAGHALPQSPVVQVNGPERHCNAALSAKARPADSTNISCVAPMDTTLSQASLEGAING